MTFNPNPNEVKDTKYVSPEELKQFLADADAAGTPITPWFRLIVNNFIYKWWAQLDDLPSMRDDLIHRM